jgi:hypothetical protein
MYCPVDGTEWREGITRCPEHDVDLVDDPPEPEGPRPSSPSAWVDALAGPASVVVALAGIVYAAAGAASSLWGIVTDDVTGPVGPSGVTVIDFAQSAAWAVGIGAFGCLAAAVLSRAYPRLRAAPVTPAYEDEDEDDEDDGDPEPREGDWFMTAVSTVTICFALAWIVLALVTAWETRGMEEGVFFSDPQEDLARLYAYQRAAAASTLGSIAVMGSLLMARAHDRLAGIR